MMAVHNANATALPAGSLVRLFECEWKWSMIGAGALRHQRLADCVANELSNTFNRCGRAVSSVLSGFTNVPLMQLERGALGLVLSRAIVDGGFPHDLSTSMHHCQHLLQMERCNARTGQRIAGPAPPVTAWRSWVGTSSPAVGEETGWSGSMAQARKVTA